MSLRSRLRSFTSSLFHRAELDSNMEAEFRFHFDKYVEHLTQSGIAPEEARRRARLELGSLATQKENCRRSLGLRLWDELIADVRFGARMLRKSPAFAAIAILSLALGIGVNTTIFTLAKSVLLDRLEVSHPEDLRILTWVSGKKFPMESLWGNYSDEGGASHSSSFSYPVYKALRERTSLFQPLFAFKDISQMTATVDGHAESISGELVSGNFYEGMRIRPIFGRGISPTDDVEGKANVVVISDAFWARRFARSPSAIGKSIEINLLPVTIVGVNPPTFIGAQMSRLPEVFMPLAAQPTVLPRGKAGNLLKDPNNWWLQIMGRVDSREASDAARQSALDLPFVQAVKSGVTIKAGRDDLPHIRVLPGRRGSDYEKSEFIKPIYVLIVLSVFVLLIACANLANLLLARSAARQREMSVRVAMGASRMRVLRQVTTESLLLSLTGGVGGVILGYSSRNLLPHLISTPWEDGRLQTRFDLYVILFTLGLSVITGLLLSIPLALQGRREDVSSGLKEGSRGSAARSHNFTNKALVIFQLSVSLVLLFGAGLFLKTLSNLRAAPIGFQPDRVLVFEIDPPRSRYTPEAALTLHKRILDTIAAVPGVQSASLSSDPLVALDSSINQFQRNDRPKDAKAQAWFNAVGTNFFETLQIPILAGRSFNSSDILTSPKVAIINQKLAHKFFPGENPIGKTFNEEKYEIVGVCGDTKYEDLKSDAPATFFVPYTQSFESNVTYEIRTLAPSAEILKSLQQAVATVDKDLPLIHARTQNEQIDATLSNQRIFALLTSAFGVLALILACIGIYGIMAYTVTRRTNEIGIRMALGAPRTKVLRMILREASTLTIIGVIIGIAASLFLARLVSTMLYGLKPSDPTALSSAAVILVAIALLAGWIPARRASRVDPMDALRHE